MRGVFMHINNFTQQIVSTVYIHISFYSFCEYLRTHMSYTGIYATIEKAFYHGKDPNHDDVLTAQRPPWVSDG